MKAAVALTSLAEVGMEVTARLAQQSADCSVALCQMLATPLLQQRSSSTPPHHHISSIPFPSSPCAVHSRMHEPTWPLAVSLPAAAASVRPPAVPVLVNLLPTQLSFSECLTWRTLTHCGIPSAGVEVDLKKKNINIKQVTQLGAPSFFPIYPALQLGGGRGCFIQSDDRSGYWVTSEEDLV